MKFPPPNKNENWTPEERLKWKTLLIQGLENLWDGRTTVGFVKPKGKAEYVCYTVRAPTAPDVKTPLHDLIQPRLEGFAFVTSWAYTNAEVNLWSGRKAQIYRKAWMESMIEEFSK